MVNLSEIDHMANSMERWLREWIADVRGMNILTEDYHHDFYKSHPCAQDYLCDAIIKLRQARATGDAIRRGIRRERTLGLYVLAEAFGASYANAWGLRMTPLWNRLDEEAAVMCCGSTAFKDKDAVDDYVAMASMFWKDLREARDVIRSRRARQKRKPRRTTKDAKDEQNVANGG